jgi:hypothetical protein
MTTKSTGTSCSSNETSSTIWAPKAAATSQALGDTPPESNLS